MSMKAKRTMATNPSKMQMALRNMPVLFALGLEHRGGVDRLLCHGLLGRSLRHLGGDLRSHGLQDRWRAGLEDRRRRRSHLIHGGKLWFLG